MTVVISDRKGYIVSTDTKFAEILSYNNYYAFGMEMPGRSYNGPKYRYGYNGQEKVDEIAPGHTTAQYWEYDSRSGRRWNIDPVFKEYESPYAAFTNNPIWFIDPLGNDTIKINQAHVINYPKTMDGIPARPSKVTEMNAEVVRCSGEDVFIWNVTTHTTYGDGSSTTGTSSTLVKPFGSHFSGLTQSSDPVFGIVGLKYDDLDDIVLMKLICRHEGLGGMLLTLNQPKYQKFVDGAKVYQATEFAGAALSFFAFNWINGPRAIKSFDDIVNNPSGLWGKSADEIGGILGEGWKKGTYGSSGNGWKFIKGDKSVFHNPSSSAHGGAQYWGFSSGTLGKNKVVDLSKYLHRTGDKANIISR